MENSEQKPLGRSPGTPPLQFRNAIILPDGRKPIPLGSGIITAILGEGGMANVYEIWNQQLEVQRAVKLLHPNCSEESKQRFQTEIKITAKLHHPNIIEIHGVGEWNGLPLIEMEKIDGSTLENMIYERGALPVTVCTAIGIMISRALRFAHNQTYVIYGKEYHGVIHRDLKPSNIMVCKDGTVKLMDFGIARPTDASIHTTDGSILGTMQYLSPEQLEGKEPDVRTDIYSLGTMLYEAVTGVQAFPERNVSKLMMNKIKNEYKPLEDFAVRIPPRLRRLINKCMHYDRDKRTVSSAALLADLEKIHKTLTIDTPEQVMKQMVSTSASEKIVVSARRRIPWVRIAAVVVFAAIAVSVFSMATKLRASRELKQQEISAIEAKKRAEEEAAKIELLATKKAAEQIAKQGAEKKQTVVRPSRPAGGTVKVAPAAPKPQARTTEQKNFEETMIERHGTADMTEILVAEFNRGNYQNAAQAIKQLSPDQAETPKAVIYRIRTISALGQISELRTLLYKTKVVDGEVYLEKAKMAFRDNKVRDAAKLLELANHTPHPFLDSEKMRREYYYYKAMCSTSLFDSNPTEEAYKSALDAWWQVRNEIRSSPTHPYNKTAIDETQKIGEKYRKIKG